MLILKRQESFCASHRLFNPQWSDEKNFEVYGKCSHKNGHGHNYGLEVCVKGEIDPSTGMIYSLSDLKALIQSQILDDVDHKHLNFDVPWLFGKVPTSEVLAQSIWERLESQLKQSSPTISLHSVTVFETAKNSVTKTQD
jgi:6-pyruvoyltetrahydropterin/6-carboxytetrahydropterin synthase